MKKSERPQLLLCKKHDDKLKELGVKKQYYHNFRKANGIFSDNIISDFNQSDESLSSIIYSSFQFDGTPEGFDFWVDICNKVK
jgi:hypothetical protein